MTSSRKGDAVVGFRDESTLLNTDDLKHALDIAVNLGHPPSDKSPNGTYRLFEVPFTCKRALWDNWLGHRQGDAFQNFTESERARAVRGLLVKALDMDGDGRITPKDLQLLYETRLTSTLTRHEDTLNKWLPLAGQCAFGGLMGLSVGAVARGAYKRKYRIAGIGFAVYTGAQYLAQQNFVNQRLLEKAFREKVRQLADVNGDGEVNREDINALVENRVKFVATKLGPGGLAPGMAGAKKGAKRATLSVMLVSAALYARALVDRKSPQLWGAPGAPIIRMRGHHVVWKFQSYDIFVEHTHRRRNSDIRLLHYLGKHCPHPQKSLWSPDTPVTQDRHLFMLTTVDVDAFKYWFGVKRCRLSVGPWNILAKSGLLPPSYKQNSKIMPKPIFDKEKLMKYYLANRKDQRQVEREDYLSYKNSMTKSPEERAAERPVAPFL